MTNLNRPLWAHMPKLGPSQRAVCARTHGAWMWNLTRRRGAPKDRFNPEPIAPGLEAHGRPANPAACATEPTRAEDGHTVQPRQILGSQAPSSCKQTCSKSVGRRAADAPARCHLRWKRSPGLAIWRYRSDTVKRQVRGSAFGICRGLRQRTSRALAWQLLPMACLGHEIDDRRRPQYEKASGRGLQ